MAQAVEVYLNKVQLDQIGAILPEGGRMEDFCRELIALGLAQLEAEQARRETLARQMTGGGDGG